MSEKELREKYGGKLAKALNRAIRAEIPSGNEALDRLAKLSGPAAHSGWKDESGKATVEAQAYEKHLRQVVTPLESQIRQKYGLPPRGADEDLRNPTTRAKAKSARRPKRPAGKPKRGLPKKNRSAKGKF